MSADRSGRTDPLPPPESTLFDGTRLITGGIAAAASGIVITVVLGIKDARQALFAWLIAFAFVLTICLGALILLMSVLAMSAKWPTLVRRLIEAVASPLPALAVVFVPVVAGASLLFPWVDPGAIVDPHARDLVLHKRPYLNVPFFVVRAVIFFALWGAVASLLRRWSLARDTDPEKDVSAKIKALAAGALPAVGLAWTFSSFDWFMSLTPTWFSTMYGVYMFAGGFVAAIALVTLLTYAADRAGILPGVKASHYSALGRLELAFVVFWAYAAFFQFMLIWIGNKPIEVPFFIARMHGGFGVMSVVLIVGQFALPFAALLSYRLKRRRELLAVVSGWLVAIHYFDVHWLIAPAARPTAAVFQWADAGALLAVGGAAVVLGALSVRGRSIVPRNDPSMEEALKYESA